MTHRDCSVEGCDSHRDSASFCNRHWNRWKKYGDPLAGSPRNYSTPDEAIAARTSRAGDCLEWTGSRNADGYGRMYVAGKIVAVHRYVWERENGPIPEGLIVRHRCDNPPCVKPEHLVLGTHQQNLDDMVQRNRSTWQKYPGVARAESLSGFRNVRPHKGKYEVRIQKDGVSRYFGIYPTAEEAAEVAAIKRAELFAPTNITAKES